MSISAENLFHESFCELNASFLEFLLKAMEEQPEADWSQAMHDYIKHVENLNANFVNSKTLSTPQKDTIVATSDLIETRPVKRIQHLISWDCPTCGKVNLSIHLICSCGVNRPVLPVTQCYIEKLMFIETTERFPDLPDDDDFWPDSPPSSTSMDEMKPVLSSSISASKQIFENNLVSQVSTTSLNSSNVPPETNLILSASLLTDIIGFFSRHRLELMSVTCGLINSLVNLYFGQHPYRRFKTHELDIFIDEKGLPLLKLHIHIHFTYIHEMWNWPEPRDDILSLDPRTGHWSTSDTLFSVNEMLAFLGTKSLRIALTNIQLSNVGCSTEGIAQLESISHVWNSQQIHIQETESCPTVATHLLKSFLDNKSFFQCWKLSLGKMSGRLFPHPNLYNIYSLEWCYAPSTTAEVNNVIEIVEHKAYSPESIIYFVVNFKKYTTVFGEDFKSLDATYSLDRLQENLNCLLNSFQQWFAEAKVKNPFHLLITAECKYLEFRKQNHHTKEVLEFAKMTDELKKYQHMYCAPWSFDDRCDCSEQYMLRRFSV